ncbi:hypothetical protein HUT18_28485 [Streptomyces sp. NA04227]|uniref:hypothetical protein n=1 Tax=Streptomyces sp. NA04227 TaxID=2742136 RepID=UPI001590022F|nr:hypothetical protein [Streptomyces sp. NA04227]QKW09760.1 hypothetical protein HUT18_28485 [Streptomyces sp. NA04227]
MSDQPTATEEIREAELAREELDAAVRAAGVTLPSLTLDPLSFAGSRPLPLISLGRCNLATARALAAAVLPRTGEADQ